jgi:hypothetical protein
MKMSESKLSKGAQAFLRQLDDGPDPEKVARFKAALDDNKSAGYKRFLEEIGDDKPMTATERAALASEIETKRAVIRLLEREIRNAGR